MTSFVQMVWTCLSETEEIISTSKWKTKYSLGAHAALKRSRGRMCSIKCHDAAGGVRPANTRRASKARVDGTKCGRTAKGIQRESDVLLHIHLRSPLNVEHGDRRQSHTRSHPLAVLPDTSSFLCEWDQPVFVRFHRPWFHIHVFT